MPRKVAVLFVHGIYNLNLEYHKPMQDRIVAALPKRLREFVDFEPVNWAEIVREHQRDYLQKCAQQGLFDATTYRCMALQGLGDAAAYQKTRIHTNSSYYQIQGEVRAAIDRLDGRGEPDRPLIVIGHSLGCHILSSFAWDINTIKRFTPERLQSEDNVKVREFHDYLMKGSAFRRLDTLAGFVSMGNNMPLFTFTFGPKRIVPITQPRREGEHPAFPGEALDPAVKDRARWNNYYSRHDILGFPLRPLNGAYAAEPRLTDFEVVSEGWPKRIFNTFWPALSAYSAHTGYWTTKPVIKGAARLITDIITAGDSMPKSRFDVLRGAKPVPKPSATAPAPGGTAPSLSA